MVGVVFNVGTAGSGKSLMTASLWDWLRRDGQRVSILNLDPGAVRTPYEPDIDVRSYINVNELMDQYGLGPNGSLVLAMDLSVDHIEKINEEIRTLNPDYLLVDTSGQMELFAYRASGQFFAEHLYGDSKLVLFLFDGVFCKDPRNFISTTLLASSLHFRFMIPVVNIMTKTDLLDEGVLKRELRWSTKSSHLVRSLERKIQDEEIFFASRLAKLLRAYFDEPGLIPVSALELTNFSTLVAAITRVLHRGEETI
ncbi:MAG: ATP/GTP-binding protein [Candidatus Geothermarchaeales archaeon]